MFFKCISVIWKSNEPYTDLLWQNKPESIGFILGAYKKNLCLKLEISAHFHSLQSSWLIKQLFRAGLPGVFLAQFDSQHRASLKIHHQKMKRGMLEVQGKGIAHIPYGL